MNSFPIDVNVHLIIHKIDDCMSHLHHAIPPCMNTPHMHIWIGCGTRTWLLNCSSDYLAGDLNAAMICAIEACVLVAYIGDYILIGFCGRNELFFFLGALKCCWRIKYIFFSARFCWSFVKVLGIAGRHFRDEKLKFLCLELCEVSPGRPNSFPSSCCCSSNDVAWRIESWNFGCPHA